ncbi:MAG: TldD/PmbA family protein [Gammaproteobacteria bacterium]|nr:TldD/PmbA family protein [Gammaproteobacteria bacterium]
MKILYQRKLIFAICSMLLLASSTLHAKDLVLDTMAMELDRSFQTLQEETNPPYFLSYEITEEAILSISGAFGQVTGSENSVNRLLDIDLRVGDHLVDNTHPVRMPFGFGTLFDMVLPLVIPVDDPEALRTVLWIHTDKKFKQAVTQFTNVENILQAQVEKDDKSGDFSQTPTENYVEGTKELVIDEELLKRKIRLYTQFFSEAEHIRSNSATLSGKVETRWFVNSEGTRIKVSHPYFRLAISASTKADDGMVLSKSITFEGSTQESLLQDTKIVTEAQQLIADLKALREAPLAEPYTGPAILYGRATGVFFHEILGHRLEGHRLKDDDDGQTFLKAVNTQILPESISVVFDPTVDYWDDTVLIGSYKFDNQGVKGRRVVIVDRGVLKGFLMSRRPLEGFPTSNGHGRKSTGNLAIARQSNMFVEVENPVSYETLEQMLIDRVIQEDKPYGLIFHDIQGGFTNTGVSMPNAFQVTPVLVYKLFPDGKKEVIRGANLIGTPLTTFSRVEQGADDYAVFNGMCGAESGWVPVSTVAPSLLVSQIEVQKSGTSRDIPPILPSPVRPPADRSIHTH